MKRFLIVGFLMLAAVPLSGWAEDFLIQDGDRVVIWGDSITDNAYYPRSMENYVLSHYPDWTVEFHNLGWGGDRSVTLERMKRDLPQFDPTFVTIKLGMNDGSYTAFTQENYDKYINGYRQLLDFLRANTKARIVLITTVPYELDVRPVQNWNNNKIDMSAYPDTLRRFSDGVKELAKEYDAGCIDLNALYQQSLSECKAKDTGFKLSGDAVHPDVNGQGFMAYHILQGLNASEPVAEITLDVQSKKIVSEKGSYVRNLSVKDNTISFTRHDSAVPFRFSGEENWKANLTQKEKWYNDLNRDWLVIKNLEQPFVSLAIDDEHVGIFSREQLEKGINLSLLPNSAMLKQGALIADMTEKRHAAEYTRWRRILLKGVRSPFDYTPYLPENVYSRYQQNVANCFHYMQLKYNDPAPRSFVLTCGEKGVLEEALKN